MEFLYALTGMLNAMSPYILLGFLIAGLLHVFVPSRLMSRHLSGTGLKSVTKAALFGVPLPLCSCGVLPAGVSLRRNGASRAASTSFMIATPQTGVDSIAATYSLLGGGFAVIRPLAAMVTAIFGGVLTGRGEKDADGVEVACRPAPNMPKEAGHQSFGRKVVDAVRYGFFDMVQSIGGWLVAGLIIAALITMLVPEDFFVRFKDYTFVTMLAVVLVSVPMYVCATGSIPIAMSLMLKGLSPGTAFVLLMAGPAANFASITVVSKAMGKRAAATYLGSIVAGALLFGLAIDYLMPSSWFELPMYAGNVCHHGGTDWFSTLCSALLVALLAVALVKNRKHSHNHTIEAMEYKIKGMNCQHCRATVEKGIAGLDGVTSVSVDLSSGIARVEGEVEPQRVASCVRSLGFDVEE